MAIMQPLAARMNFEASPPAQLRQAGKAWSFEAANFRQAKRVFTVLAEQGEVVSPFEAIGPAASGGSVIDKFGKLWIVTCVNACGLEWPQSA